jgi:trehalose-6-phosphatase
MSLPEPLTALGAAALEAIVRSPSETLIASDFDGTLAPIVDDPERAYADPDAVAALGRLGEHVGAVVVIFHDQHAKRFEPAGHVREVAYGEEGEVRRRSCAR